MSSLEQEFLEQVFVHKSSVVLAALVKYYNDIEDTGVVIPDFMSNTPLEKAQRHYFELLGDKNKFNEIYEQCWKKYGELLP